MRQAALLIGGLIGGIALGAAAMIGIQDLASDDLAAVPVEMTSTAGPDPATTSTLESSVQEVPSSEKILLVWTPGGLPEGFAAAVADLEHVTAVTSVRSDLVRLRETRDQNGVAVDILTEGFVIPLELMAYDPATYESFLSKRDMAAFAAVGPGEVLLGTTSAEIRRLGPGGVLVLDDGTALTVSAVVDDVLIGAAEAAVPVGQLGDAGASTERYLLIRHSGERKVVEEAIRGLLPDGLGVRVRAPGETPVLRHGDAVLPQVAIKDLFGEFAYQPGDGLAFDIDPAWVGTNLMTAEVPILGEVTCHRSLLPALTGALAELEERNLAFLVDPSGFRGCFNPRYIAGRKGISRHAWGVAIDINIGSNPEGLSSIQDPRLLEVMERWGFTSGHEWLIPDPGHFEYVRSATRG